MSWLFSQRMFDEYMPNLQSKISAEAQERIVSITVEGGCIACSPRLMVSASALLDSYGNMSRGQIQKVLSQLRA